ncbi:ATP-binding protein [Streptomyces sp. NPDC002838]|uniref:ATP-binding protein n=1 Tax=Streptomyces sp. NPDC002838 TaxID=3154436 RepID=UPI003331EF32
MAFELHLLATPKAVPEVRHLLRHHSYEVHLCASELVTNVIDHLGEGAPVTVRVLTTGHGRALLDALARRWGVEQGAGRKTVWCELEAEPYDAAGHEQRPAQDTGSWTGRSRAGGYFP